MGVPLLEMEKQQNVGSSSIQLCLTLNIFFIWLILIRQCNFFSSFMSWKNLSV